MQCLILCCAMVLKIFFGGCIYRYFRKFVTSCIILLLHFRCSKSRFVMQKVARSILSTFLILLHNIWMLNWKCWIFYYFDTLLFRCCQPEWSKHDFEYWKETILISNQKKLLFFGWWEIRMGFRSSYEVDGPCISLLDIYFVGRWSTTSHISFVTDLSVYSYGV